jgi:glycosyltransferase involved in cell wall biosynthesis
MTSRNTQPVRRILYVVNEDWVFLLNRLPMARAARDAGFEVHVATNVNKGAAAIEAEGFILHAIPFGRGGLSPLAAVQAVQAIRNLESQIRPDIVHHSGVLCCVFGSLAALDRDFPTVNAITGLGYIFTSASLRSRMLKLAMTWLLPRLLDRRQSITWLGHIGGIVPLWRASHIAYLPSHREGLPGALMEAAASGRPLVATNAPGCREICIADQTGLLVPIEDPEALASAILKLAQSAELRTRYGAAARKLVEDKLSARIIGQSTAALYNTLTRGKSESP